MTITGNHLDFTIQLVLDAGKLLMEHYQQPELHAELKKDRTIITEADLAADQYIAQQIKNQYPDDHILSEEFDTTYPGDNRATWIIDPLDGTANYTLGVHYWGVSIARVENGWPTTAALYFPVFNELFSAQRGQGAKINGKSLIISYQPNHPAALFTRDSRAYRHYNINLRIKSRVLGSAAYNFCAVAKGVSVVGFETSPKIWDIAGSWLILEEAGGAIGAFGSDPFPLIPNKNYLGQSYPVIGAATRELLKAAQEKIIPK